MVLGTKEDPGVCQTKVPPSRIGHIICWAQYKMKMQGTLFKECQDNNSRVGNAGVQALPHSPQRSPMGLQPASGRPHVGTKNGAQ